MFDVSDFQESDKEQWDVLWHGYEVADAPQEEISKTTAITWHNIFNDSECYTKALRLSENGLAVGFVSYVTHHRFSSYDKKCYIANLFVLPEWQSKGGGQMLIDSVIDFAKENSLSQVTWITMPDNSPAQALYNKVAKSQEWIRYKVDME